MRYHVTTPDLMDFFCPEGHQGFPLADIRAAEASLGVALPEAYRTFLLTYGLDPICRRHDCIRRPPEEIVTTYQCIRETLADWEEDFQAATEKNDKKVQDNGYFALWRLPEAGWDDVTDNYVLIWQENQGVWNAGYRLQDLLAGLPDPPVYISTRDDFITFEKCADGLDSFLRSILWGAAYGYHGGARLTDSAETSAALAQAGIGQDQLIWREGLAVCLDDEGETLYLYHTGDGCQELRIAGRHESAPGAVPVMELPRRKYVPNGPYRVGTTLRQGPPKAGAIHIHPLIAHAVGQGHGKHLLVPYDWIKAMGKMKGLCLGLRDVTIEQDGTAYAQIPYNLPQSFYLDPSDWSIMEKMPNLQTLRIENLIVDDFSFLSKCKDLRVLSLYNTNFSDCRLLLALPKLKEADLRFCPLEHTEVLETLDIHLV